MWKTLVEVSDTGWTESSERRSVFFLVSLPSSVHVSCRSTLCEGSSLCTPSSLLLFFLSVLLFLCFVLFLSFSPSSFPLLAVVCRHAGISGPQNDRPNLSGLAPVTKDGCFSQCVCLWLVHVLVSSRAIGCYMFVHIHCWQSMNFSILFVWKV